jgi:hypothetical protein
MKAVTAALAFAGCWNTPAAPPKPPATPIVRLALADDTHVRFVEVGTELRVARTVEVAGDVIEVAWVGPDPTVLLATGTIGRITAAGFTPYPPLPETTWATLDANVPAGYRRSDRWSMRVAANGEVWQAHCRWVTDPYESCAAWLYARIDKPGATGEPPAGPPDLALPEAVPPRDVVVTLDPEEPRSLHCRGPGGATLDYPEPQILEKGMSRVRWIANDPPLYTSDHTQTAMDDYTTTVIFRGCTVASEYETVDLFGGPDGLAVIAAQTKVAVVRHGRVIGTLPGATNQRGHLLHVAIAR